MAIGPYFRMENERLWHSWDGYEWWNGEPDEVTRSLTRRRIGSSTATSEPESICEAIEIKLTRKEVEVILQWHATVEYEFGKENRDEHLELLKKLRVFWGL